MPVYQFVIKPNREKQPSQILPIGKSIVTSSPFPKYLIKYRPEISWIKQSLARKFVDNPESDKESRLETENTAPEQKDTEAGIMSSVNVQRAKARDSIGFKADGGSSVTDVKNRQSEKQPSERSSTDAGI
jgi:hypothetical protein